MSFVTKSVKKELHDRKNIYVKGIEIIMSDGTKAKFDIYATFT